ncbi:hypothetical protein B0H13DRAFT_1908819 [Mycena leptocephala]|nr:hypothetical protein B0H13DRAFT_1908819 [Mycena leptocephala]
MANQCALDANGALLDASDIQFYQSESDEKALPVVSSEPPQRRSTRKRKTDRLTESLAAEKVDDDGQPLAPRVPRARATVTTRIKLLPESVSDEEDEDFDDLPDLEEVSHSSDEGSDSESDVEMVDNEETFYRQRLSSARWGGLVEAPNPPQVLRHQAQGRRVHLAPKAQWRRGQKPNLSILRCCFQECRRHCGQAG